MQLVDIFNNSSSVIVYEDNSAREFYKGESEYSQILNGWNELVADSYEMPAYGVSLDNLTRKDMKCGEWIEFIFDGKCEYNELPFERLLVRVEEEYSGFNVIRYMSDVGYSGRCFYIQLNGKNMSKFSDLLKKL